MESVPDVIEECTNLQWSKISLSALPQLEREVDRVAKLFLQVQLHGDGEMIEQVFNSISERVDQLESFYWEHNRDPRIMLLEKQRLRLKKCLQGRRAPSPPVALSFAQGRNSISISAEEYASASSPSGQNFQHHTPQAHLQSNQDSHMSTVDSFGNNPTRETRNDSSPCAEISPSSRGSPRSPRRELMKDDAQNARSRRVSTVTKQSTDSTMRKGVQPIYAWERKGSMLHQQQMEQQQQQYGGTSTTHANTNNRRSSDMSSGTTQSNDSSCSDNSNNSVRDSQHTEMRDKEEEPSPDEVATFKVVLSEKDYHRIKARQWVVQSGRRYRELHQASTLADAEVARARTLGAGKSSSEEGTTTMGDETMFLSGDSAYEETKLEYRAEDPYHWLDSRGFRRLTRTDVTPRW